MRERCGCDDPDSFRDFRDEFFKRDRLDELALARTQQRGWREAQSRIRDRLKAECTELSRTSRRHQRPPPSPVASLATLRISQSNSFWAEFSFLILS